MGDVAREELHRLLEQRRALDWGGASCTSQRVSWAVGPRQECRHRPEVAPPDFGAARQSPGQGGGLAGFVLLGRRCLDGGGLAQHRLGERASDRRVGLVHRHERAEELANGPFKGHLGVPQLRHRRGDDCVHLCVVLGQQPREERVLA